MRGKGGLLRGEWGLYSPEAVFVSPATTPENLKSGDVQERGVRVGGTCWLDASLANKKREMRQQRAKAHESASEAGVLW